MKRVAIPVDEGKLSEYFGNCSHYKIFEIGEGFINEKIVENPVADDADMIPEWAFRQGISDIIVHKLDKKIIMLFSKYKINLYVGIPVEAPEKILEEFINEKLVSNRKIITEIIESQ